MAYTKGAIYTSSIGVFMGRLRISGLFVLALPDVPANTLSGLEKRVCRKGAVQWLGAVQ